jgi:ParB/RepB/Spo0J family partition protein
LKNYLKILIKMSKSTQKKIEYINIDNIFPSPTNPRKGYDVKALEELAKSIKEHGVLQPILVREIADGFDAKGKQQFSIVYGERRYKASILAGLKTIPAEVRNIDDNQAFEIQILENLQREDINPLDEARAFQSLMKKESLDWLASKINKSKKYVLDRVKLLDLCEEAMSALEMGVLPLGHAVLLSKIDIEKQEKVIKSSSLFAGQSMTEGTSKMYCAKTLSQLKSYITDTMLSFTKVNFDLDDLELLPKAGSCQACPKRTINQNLLFGDITDNDMCTDSFCFNAKIKRHTENQIEIAKQAFGDVQLAETDMYSNLITLQDTKQRVQYNREKNDTYTIPVVITKTSNYEMDKMGKTVWIEAPKEEEGEVKPSGPSNWELKNAKEFDELIVPRFNELIGACVNFTAATKVANSYLVEKMTELNLKNLLIIAHILGLQVLKNLSYFEILDLIKDKTRDEDYAMCFELAKSIVNSCTVELVLAILSIENVIDWDFDEEESVQEWEVTITKIYQILGLEIPQVESDEE